VEIIAPFPNRPGGELYPGYTHSLFSSKKVPAGYIVHRCFSYISRESGAISRFLENISFGLTGGGLLLRSSRPDVIYSNTWPVFATGIVYLISLFRRIPLVLSVQDIYPESLVSQGRLSGDSLLVRGMRFLDGVISRGAEAVIVVGKCFADIYNDNRGVKPNRLHTIYNWVDERNAAPKASPNIAFRKRLGVPLQSFLVVYGGNVGMAAGIETAIEAFALLKEHRNLSLLIAGDGGSLPRCRQLVVNLGLKRVIFLSPWPTEQTSEVLSAADLLLLPTRGAQSAASVPSKLIAYMLAARPILALALPRSEIASIVKDAGCGWVIQPDLADKLAIKLEELASEKQANLDGKGLAGREYARKNLTTHACMPRVINVIKAAASRGQGPVASGKQPFSRLRPMSLSDVRDVVHIHLASFPGFFLSILGPKFLRLYYSQVCSSEDGMAFVYESKPGVVEGFAVGSSNPSGFYSRLLQKHWFRFMLAAMGPVCSRPAIIPRLLRALAYPGQNPQGANIAGLYSIAVAPTLRGGGAGERLVRAFLSLAKKRGCAKVFLTTDKVNNKPVNIFYLRQGFVLEREYITAEGRIMNEYWFDLVNK
jgi:glycosyltransferase involved in cell wall biosynthesis/ribosomal protein S18 acetylase RimI-like enzyme